VTFSISIFMLSTFDTYIVQSFPMMFVNYDLIFFETNIKMT